MSRDALVITGATATGKTTLSLALAELLDGEIISMDSRQIYRGMDIGTAKADVAQRARVPHHGLDLVDPNERYSAGQFARDARQWITGIHARGRVPILTGGTGFFLRALTHPLFAEPPMATDRRDALRHLLAGYDDVRLVAFLDALDPESAGRLREGGGRQRMARAIEVVLLTGHSIGWWHARAPDQVPALAPTVAVLELPREDLYARIDERVHTMVAAGLVDEVRRLLAAGYDERDPALNATGYAELIPYIRGKTDLTSAVDAIQRASRRYARRQETWFRHQLPSNVIRLDARRSVEDLTEEIARHWAGEVSSANRN